MVLVYLYQGGRKRTPQTNQPQENDMNNATVTMKPATILAAVPHFVTYTKPGASKPYVMKTFNCRAHAFEQARNAEAALLSDHIMVWKSHDSKNWISYPKNEWRNQ